MDLHQSVRFRDRFESSAAIEPVRISGREQPTAKPLEIGVLEHFGHEPFPQTLTPMIRENEDVREVRERGVVRNHTSESDLIFRFGDGEQTEVE